MKRSSQLVAWGGIVQAAVAAMLVVTPGRALTLTTPTVTVELTDGVVTSLTNRLTGETIAAPRGDLHGLWRRDGRAQFSWHHGTVAGQGNTVTDATNAGTVTSTFGTDGDAVTVAQSGRAPQGGLRGIQWGLCVPEANALLVPGLSGQRFDADTPLTGVELHYPQSWECQCLLIETPRGGFLIQATDVAEHFKRLHLQRAAHAWQIGFESEAAAPWDKAAETTSPTWRIVGYRGPWTTGAALYRTWAAKAFGMTAVERQTPAWVGQIQFVAISDLRPELLKGLAQRVDPTKTLIYVPSWRRDGYDRNYPDYTPIDGFPAQVKAAQALGFRVMLHCNYFGCTPENPAYQALKQYHTRSPYNDELEYWDWQRSNPPIKFAYIDPAAKAWRDLLVQKMREVVAVTGCDALHLDQTLCIENDANGLIDGLNMMQGNLALHRELRAALPQVALSGEGLDEVTCVYEAFAQRHLAGLNHADHRFDLKRIALAHPISSAILRPHTAIYGYLGYVSPLDTEMYLAWELGYQRFGVLPTLVGWSAGDLAHPAPLVDQLLNTGKQFAELQPRPVFDDASAGVLFAWQAKDGSRLEYVAEPTGAALRHGDELLSRWVGFVPEARLPGTVEGALGYDAERVFGLDPERMYAWTARPRDLAAPHVSAADAPVVIKGVLTADSGRLELADPVGEVRLWEHGRRGRSGVRLRDGTERWNEGLSFREPTGGHATPTGDGWSVHPPFQYVGEAKPGAKVDGLGETVIEETVPLPADAAFRFEALVGLQPDPATKQSDGVTFRVTATAGQSLRAEVHVPAGPLQPLRLDLAPLAGRTVTLQLAATPGPAGNPSFDWALWQRPRLVRAEPRPVRLTLSAERAWGGAWGVPAATVRQLDAQHSEVTTTAPGSVLLTAAPPARPRAGQALGELPFTALLRMDDGRALAPFGYMRPGKGDGHVGGVTRAALLAHPPDHGMIEESWLLALPPEPLRLKGFVGLEDGNQSKGAGFRIRLGEREVWRGDHAGGADSWQPFTVDLTPWAGQSVPLVLVVDSLGAYDFDWARWGEVRFEAAG